MPTNKDTCSVCGQDVWHHESYGEGTHHMTGREHEKLAQAVKERDELKVIIQNLEGNLGHPVPQEIKLVDVKENVLAKFIAAERDNLKTALSDATKRSNYPWSEGGKYNEQDWKNEGMIELARKLSRD